MKREALLAACCLSAAAVFAQESWTFEKPYVWARDKNAVKMAQNGASTSVEHVGKQDWSLGGFARIAAKPGDIFELSCRIKAAVSSGEVDAKACVVLRDEKGEASNWSYGGAAAKAGDDWQTLHARFVIPKGTATIEPRLIGSGPVSLQVDGYTVARQGSVLDRVNPAMKPQQSFTNGNLTLSGDFASGTLDVTDKRTGRVWRQELARLGYTVLDASPLEGAAASGLVLKLLNPATLSELRATFTLQEGNEMAVTLDASEEMPAAIDFPAPFATRKGDRLIVPMNEGMSYPVEEEHQGLHRMIAYGGHGICMAFFGVAEDATGAGWMCILETSDDAAMNAYRGSDGLWVAGPSWDPQMGRFGYTRKMRYVFFDQGGHVAICKRYRAYVKSTGLYTPFKEKVKHNPNIDLLIGAANIWLMGKRSKEPADMVKEMQALGMRRILWSGGGSAEQIRALREIPDVLVGRYDIYQDIMDPANFERIGYKHGDWVTEAFPQDINWYGPSAAQWRHGWQVKAKDGTMIPCAVLCDSKAVPYARSRISEELKTKPFTARFIDTTVASPWRECYNPAHPMTRTQSREYKMQLLKLMGDFGLVCGSETGHEASVPFCDYFEGMLSVGPYRVPDSGRNTLKIWDDVPERVAKYQVGEAYRLPLWELVYHDCVVAQWYWGDYNNKLPKIWRKRDLFNALYGTPPMYMFDSPQWEEKKAQFAASYQVSEPVSRATGYCEMTDHRVLTPDRTVQQSVFANGVTVTANFGDKPYRTAEGAEIPPMDVKVSGM